MERPVSATHLMAPRKKGIKEGASYIFPGGNSPPRKKVNRRKRKEFKSFNMAPPVRGGRVKQGGKKKNTISHSGKKSRTGQGLNHILWEGKEGEWLAS